MTKRPDANPQGIPEGWEEALEALRPLNDAATQGEFTASECMDVWIEAGGLGVAKLGDHNWCGADNESTVNTEEAMRANGAFFLAAMRFVRAALNSPSEALSARPSPPPIGAGECAEVEAAVLLRRLHDWFLESAPDQYRGCGLWIDVEAALGRSLRLGEGS